MYVAIVGIWAPLLIIILVRLLTGGNMGGGLWVDIKTMPVL